jgi:hypothetical protein
MSKHEFHVIYSDMTDIHDPHARWIKLHYDRDAQIAYSVIKGSDLTDVTRFCTKADLAALAVVEAYPKERDKEITDFIFYQCFEEGKGAYDTAKAALVKFPAYELRAFLYGYMNPISIEQCETIEQWIEECLVKREDLYWENHRMNQD